jgi:hypothetical protein
MEVKRKLRVLGLLILRVREWVHMHLLACLDFPSMKYMIFFFFFHFFLTTLTNIYHGIGVELFELRWIGSFLASFLWVVLIQQSNYQNSPISTDAAREKPLSVVLLRAVATGSSAVCTSFRSQTSVI